MIELSTIRDLVAIFGVLAGLSYYILTVRNATKSRKTQLVMMLRNQIQSRDSSVENMRVMDMEWDSFEDFRAKYDSTINVENYSARTALWGSYDSVGYMLYQRLIDAETVYNMLGSHQTLLVWNKFKGIIHEQRKFYNNPHWYRWMEYLASQVSKERVRQDLLQTSRTRMDIQPDNPSFPPYSFLHFTLILDGVMTCP
jgi:hypothetical protein